MDWVSLDSWKHGLKCVCVIYIHTQEHTRKDESHYRTQPNPSIIKVEKFKTANSTQASKTTKQMLTFSWRHHGYSVGVGGVAGDPGLGDSGGAVAVLEEAGV